MACPRTARCGAGGGPAGRLSRLVGLRAGVSGWGWPSRSPAGTSTSPGSAAALFSWPYKLLQAPFRFHFILEAPFRAWPLVCLCLLLCRDLFTAQRSFSFCPSCDRWHIMPDETLGRVTKKHHLCRRADTQKKKKKEGARTSAAQLGRVNC